MSNEDFKVNPVLFFFGVLCTCGLLSAVFDPAFFGEYIIEAKIGFGLVGLFFYIVARTHAKK
jgi:hypothetical protein